MTLFSPRARRFSLGLAAAVAAVAAFPLATDNPYYLNVANITALYVLVVTGLNLLIGYAGHISLGHAAFFGLGAYLSAVLTGSHGFPPWPTLFLAACCVALLALVVGLPTLRLKGNYLVMATLGFNIIVGVFMVQLDDITGGPSGYVGVPPLTLFGEPLATDLAFYPLAWGLALAGLIPARNCVHSRVGRALRALHVSPRAAAACGVPVERYKVAVFVLSAVYASVAGSLYAHYLGIVTPGTFDIFASVKLVTMCLIGGMGSLWGGFAGAVFLTPLPQFLGFFEEHHDLVFGGVLLVLLMFAPGGLAGLLSALFRRRHGE